MKITNKISKFSIFHNYDVNIDEYLNAVSEVKQNMKNQEWFGCFTKDAILGIIAGGGDLWTLYNGNELVCSMMGIPSNVKDIEKFKLQLDYKIVIDYGPMFVVPKYIGNGLQYMCINYMNDYYIKKKYKYAITTIHPSNLFSINNFIKSGFIFSSEQTFPRGERKIYIKKY